MKRHELVTESASVHVHSSVTVNPASAKSFLMRDFLPEGNCDSRTKADLVVTLVWKQSTGVELLPALVSDPQKRPLVGEVNIGRYLAQHQPPGSGATGLDGSLSAQKTLKVCSLSPFGRKLVNDENY